MVAERTKAFRPLWGGDGKPSRRTSTKSLVAPYLKALRWSIGSLAPIPSLSDQLPSPCHFAASRGHDLRGGRCVTPRVDITCRYSENTNEGRSLAPRLPPAHHQPVSSEPYLRRRGGMMVVSGDVAISGRASGSSGATRAYPPWTNGRRLRFPIGFVFAEDPKRRFGQMPGHGPDGLRVALAPGNANIEATHVALRRPPVRDTDRVGGFDECPFEIPVDVRARRPEPGLPTARVDARRRARIGGQLLGGGKPRDLAHFEGDHDGERESYPRHAQEQLDCRRQLERALDPVLERTHLAVQTLDLLEQLLASVRRVRRQEGQALPQEGAAPHAKDIAHLGVVQSVLGQGGVNPILELRALPDEHHPGARQVALVPQLAGRNPDRGQRAVLLQPVEPPHVEPIGLVDLPHHQLRLARVHELGHAASGLDLVDDPVPVADRLYRDGRSPLATFQDLAQRAAGMLNPFLSHELAVGPHH